MNTRYDTDFYAWTQEQAALLRDQARELDWDNLAEEIESVGISDKRALTSQLTRLLLHLLKWRYQPPHRGHSWQDSLTDARRMIRLIVRDSPSLRTWPATRLAEAYADARQDAAQETGLPLATFPPTCPWKIDTILDRAFFPEGNDGNNRTEQTPRIE